MRLLLDSNIIIDAAAGAEPAMEVLKQACEAEWAGISAITRLEVFGYPGLLPKEEEILSAILSVLDEVPVDRDVITRAIDIRRLRRNKSPDAIIAATAIEKNAVIATRNVQDFQFIDGLEIYNPRE